ncbi:MAG: polysaccharide biosynthesis tyrosine autokinase [Bacteroidota bacterium]
MEQTNSIFDNQQVEVPDSFEIRELLFAFLRNWYWVLLCVGISFLAARMYLRYTIPVYQANSKILIKQDAGSGGGLSEEAVLQELGVLKSSNNLNNEIQILKSRTLMAQVVSELGLNVQYYGVGRVKTTELYHGSPIILDSVRWGRTRKRASLELEINDGESFTIFNDEEETRHTYKQAVVVERDTFWFSKTLSEQSSTKRLRIEVGQAVGRYQSKLNIRLAADYSSVLALEMEDPVRKKAIDILDKLVEVYNQAAIDDKNQVSKKTLEFIDERLVLLTEELSNVEGGLERYKEQNDISTEAGGTVGLILSEISGYDNALTQQQIQLELLNNVESSLTGGIAAFEIIPANVMLSDGEGLNREIERYNGLVLRRERLERSATPDNPELASLNKQLEEAQTSVLSSLRSLRQALQLTIRETTTKIQGLQSRINQIPRQERELLEIKRQQNIKEALYLFLLQKREETALSAAITVPNARLVDAPVAANKPISPVPLRVYAVSLLFGLMLPIGMITVREFFDNKVYSEEDVKRLSQIPVLGGVPQHDEDEHIVVRSNSRTAIAETFRLLRTNLGFLFRSKQGDESKAILVTSGLSGDGKTFISVNLGISLALINKRVILVGMDLRKPKLVQYLQNSSDTDNVGLTNFLVSDNKLEDIVQATDIHPNLFVLPSGPIPPNPSELLSREKLTELFTYLKQEFDYVVIDTSPIGLVADAFLLEPFIDNALFVARYGKTEKATISNYEQIRRENKLPGLALILNGMRKGKGSNYSYGYSYGYGYGYGYYEQDEKKSIWRRLFSKDQD